MRSARYLAVAVMFGVCLAALASAEVYQVSDLDTLADLLQNKAEPGDVIELQPGYYYFEMDRIRCARSGTPDAPIIVRGILKDGKSPVIDAIRVNVKRCVFNVRPGVHDIVFENLEIKNAAGSRYPDREETYGVNASAFYFEDCHNITCRNIDSHHNEDGFFANHGSDCILIENCHIHHNGTETKERHNATHNFYFCAKRQLVRNSHIHHATDAENFKSRADSTIFAYNWVEEEYAYSVAVDSGGKDNTLWLGNVIIKRTYEGIGQGRLLGVGDGTGVATGTLVAINNTFLTVFPRDFYLFTFESATADVVFLNNIFAGPGESFMDHNGKGSVTGSNNWIRKGTKGVPDALKNTVYGDAPGFVNFAKRNLRPKADSPLLKAGQMIETSMPYVKLVTDFHKGEVDGVSPSPIYLSAVNEIESSTVLFSPTRKGYSSQGRRLEGTGIDIGAYTYPESLAPKGGGGQKSK